MVLGGELPTNRKRVVTPVIYMGFLERVNPLIIGVISYNPLAKWDEPPSSNQTRNFRVKGCFVRLFLGVQPMCDDNPQ